MWKTKIVNEVEGHLTLKVITSGSGFGSWRGRWGMHFQFFNGDLFEIAFWMKYWKQLKKGTSGLIRMMSSIVLSEASPCCPLSNSHYFSPPSPLCFCFQTRVRDLYNRQWNMSSVAREAQVCQDVCNYYQQTYTAVYCREDRWRIIQCVFQSTICVCICESNAMFMYFNMIMVIFMQSTYNVTSTLFLLYSKVCTCYKMDKCVTLHEIDLDYPK